MKLPDQVRDVMRKKHYAIRTEHAYLIRHPNYPVAGQSHDTLKTMIRISVLESFVYACDPPGKTAAMSPGPTW